MILFFTTIAIAPIIIISILYSTIFQKTIYENLIKDRQTKLNYITLNVNAKLSEADKFVIGFSYKKDLQQLLTKNFFSKKQMDINIVKFNENAKDLWISGSVNNIIKIVLIGNNNVISQIGNDTTTIDTDLMYKENFIDNYKNITNYKIVLLPDKFGIKTMSFPISKNINNVADGKIIGDMIVFFKNTLISDALKEANVLSSEQIFIVNNDGQCLGHTDPSFNGSDFLSLDYVSSILKNTSSDNGYFEYKDKYSRKLITYKKDLDKNFTVIASSSLDSYYLEKYVLIKITSLILFLTGLISTFGVILSSNRLSRPIKDILNHIKRISEGYLELNPDIQENNEIGVIGKGINNMVTSIEDLMNKTIEKEREKKEMEFKMLQSQINPHFLYNTLNSIKWLATIQNATKITQITSALTRLLKNISKGTSEMITIYDEFIFIDDYIYIQNIRYDDKINLTYNLSSDELGSASILKFTLQPIIENAIFHGIVPKLTQGTIKVTVTKENNDLVISVKDDGVGMNSEMLQDIFSNKKSIYSKSINSIGIKNVDERLKLHYGDDYGLTITSCENVYTEVVIHIPYTNLN